MKIIFGLISEPYRRQDAVRLLLWLVMFSSLVASMRHVAWFFATLEDGSLVSGWVSAIAFDTSIFLLTFLARTRRTHERRVIKCGIIANGVITSLANLLYGLEHQLDLGRVPYWLWVSLPFIFSIALPLMVIYLAEVLSAEEQHNVQAEQKRQKRQQASVQDSSQSFQASSNAVQMNSKLGKSERLRIVQELVESGCPTVAEISLRSGFRRSSVYNYLRELGISPESLGNAFDILETSKLDELGQPLDVQKTANKHAKAGLA